MDTKQTDKADVRYTVRIEYDLDPINPRTDYEGQVCKMICFHNRYDLGDKHPYNLDYSSGDEIVRSVIEEVEGGGDDGDGGLQPPTGDKILALQPLYLMDHSGISMSTSSEMFRAFDQQGWDWGGVGFAYVTRSAMTEAGFSEAEATPEKAAAIIDAEVADYDRYLRGESYGYIVQEHRTCTCTLGAEHEHAETIDSCWGFDDLSYALAEARANFTAITGHDADKLTAEGDLAEYAD